MDIIRIIISIILLVTNIQTKVIRNDFVELDKYLTSVAKEMNGVSLVINRDGKTIFSKGYYGVNPDTPVPVASGSKLMNAAAMMMAVDDGFLNMDTTVGETIPSFTGKKSSITLTQMLSHTSGMQPENPLCLNFKITLEQCVDGLSKLPLQNNPGSEFVYGAVGFQVAARMIEVKTGVLWNDWFIDKFCKNLELENTNPDAHGRTQNPRIGGNIISSATDYARFFQMMMDGGVIEDKRYLKEETVNKIMTDHVGRAKFKSDIGIKYGLGCWFDKMKPDGTGIIVKCPGSTGFIPWIDREKKLVIIFSVKSSTVRYYQMLPYFNNCLEIIQRIVK